MSEWKAKRFWKQVTLQEVAGRFSIALDGRPVKTPAKELMALPTRGLAESVAAEWQAVEELIQPLTMPFTRTANAAIDKVAPQKREVAEIIADYAGTDLLCYRADAPDSLRARQNAAWDPLLDWAAETYGARLAVTTGVMHVPQPAEALAQLSAPVRDATNFELAALHDLVSLSGSLVIGLAVTEGMDDANALWAVSRIDETWQQELWGEDEEASAHAEMKRQAFIHAARVWALLQAK